MRKLLRQYHSYLDLEEDICGIDENKVIKRLNYDTKQIEMFIAEGEMNDGRLCYSRITLTDGVASIYHIDSCSYLQSRIDGKLQMWHI